MIKVNLGGAPRKSSIPSIASSSAAPRSSSGGAPFLRLFLMLIVAGTATVGYLLHWQLSGSLDDVTARIVEAQAKKAKFDKIIKEDQIYESRKKEIENRIKIIEGLKRDQVSPVVSLDALGQAIDRTKYVWLSNLDQNNALFSMVGTSTSVNAIADFVSNLEGTGYFHNINLVNAQDTQGNFSFSMNCEFAPPARPQLVVEAQNAGAN